MLDDTPDPLELPLGSCWGKYAPVTWPPYALQPLEELLERKFAHWLKFDFPRMMTPAALSLAAIPESWGTVAPYKAKDPAVYGQSRLTVS